MTTAPAPIPVDRGTGSPLVPLEDRIVARELPLPDIPDGSLWLPEQTAGGTTRAVVVAVGPGRRTDAGALIPPPAVVGDVVVLAEFGPTEIDVGGETLLSAPPNLVLAIER